MKIIEETLNKICGSKLWDNELIYSSNPDFTSCFQNSILIWLPCLFLWLSVPFWTFQYTKSKKYGINLTWLFCVKMTTVLGLIFMETYELVTKLMSQQNFPEVFVISPVILILTFLLAITAICLSNTFKWRYSVIMFLYWLLMFLANSIILRTRIIQQLEYIVKNTSSISDSFSKLNVTNLGFIHLDVYIFYAYYGFIIANLVFSGVSEKNFNNSTDHTLKSESLQSKANLLSYLTFWWTNNLIRTGFKRDLTKEDIYEIEEINKSETITNNIYKEWSIKTSIYLKNIKFNEENSFGSQIKPNYKSNTPEEKIELNELNNEKNYSKSQKMRKVAEPSLIICLVKVFGVQFIGIICIKIVQDILAFSLPVLLDLLLNFVKDKEQKNLIGFFYIFLLCFVSFSQTVISQHYAFSIFLIGQKIKIGLQNLIYRKSLKLSATARKSTTVGEMTNILTENTGSFERCSNQVVQIISLPIQISISIYMLWQHLRWATFVGIASIILFIPLNSYFGRLSKRIGIEKYKTQDSRIKTMNEVLTGIRVIKLYGWEESFMSIIKKLRVKELNNLIKTSLVSILSSASMSAASFLITAISFGAYILLDENNELNANTAFVSLVLIEMLNNHLEQVPKIVTGLISLNVSLNRIRKFLLKDEIKIDAVSYDPIAEYSILAENVNLGWSKSEELLSNINMKVKKGSLVAIVGKVGSGKSSLLAGLLNQMHKLNELGRINIDGKIALVPQQPWIQNATVRNNIIFYNAFNEDLYKKVLESCSLLSDLEIMLAGDNTEIGEKGINLSGGQKARVSLARSLYSNADIYMLDDPLSAVDSRVGKQIFDSVIGPNGMLKDKTRLLVTNSLNFLPQVDEIIMIEDGFIIETGTYDQLIQQNGKFSEFMKAFLEANETNQTFIKNITESSLVEKQVSMFTPNNESIKKSDSKIDTNNSIKKDSTERKIIEKEKVESGSVKMSTILEYFKACRLWLSSIFFILFFLSYVVYVSNKYWLKDWSNDSLDLNSTMENGTTSNVSKEKVSKFYRLIVYIALGLSNTLIEFLSDLVFVYMIIKATKRLHDKMLYRVLRSDLKFFESTPTGRIINRFTKDVGATEELIPGTLQTIIDFMLSLTASIFIIVSATPFILFALIPVIIVYILVQRYFIPSNRQLKRMLNVSRSPTFSHFSESQAGLMTIRAYNLASIFIKTMEDNIDHTFSNQYALNVSNRWLALRLEILGELIKISAALFAIISRNTISAGFAGLSIYQSLSISQKLNFLVRYVSEFEANITSVERIKEYCELKQEPEWSIEKTKPQSTWPETGKIKIENLYLKYRKDLDYALKEINIDISSGEKIGIVGRTGSGKSSLTLALLRMIENTEGNLLIDNIDINTIGLHDLRHKITIIPQDPVIFSGTIRMNLDPFEMHNDDDLWRALELAHLKDFVKDSDKKLEFECTEGGNNLSVGQRQLVCLARSLLRKTKVLILDEATASIDHNTDELIQNTIRTQFADCTVLTIAHRLNTIMDSTRIIVLDEGKVVEFDTPKKLLTNKKSIFYQMAEQAGLVYN